MVFTNVRATTLPTVCRDMGQLTRQEEHFCWSIHKITFQKYNLFSQNKINKEELGSGMNGTALVGNVDIGRLFRRLGKYVMEYSDKDNTYHNDHFVGNDYRKTLRFQLYIVCVELEIATRKSLSALHQELLVEKQHPDDNDDIIQWLIILLEISFAWAEEAADSSPPSITTCTTLHASILLLSRLAPLFPDSISALTMPLWRGLKKTTMRIPADLQLLAACVLVNLFCMKKNPMLWNNPKDTKNHNLSVLVSVLIRAVLSGDKDHVHSALQAFRVLQDCTWTRRKLAKRRGVAVAVCQSLLSLPLSKNPYESLLPRMSLSLAKLFFESCEEDDEFTHRFTGPNATLVATAIANILENAVTIDLVDDNDATQFLGEALQVTNFAITKCRHLDSQTKHNLLQSVAHLEQGSLSKRLASKAALVYIRSISHTETRLETLQYLISFLDSRHDDPIVCHETLLFLQDIAYWNPRALIWNSLGLLDRLAHVIRRGCNPSTTTDKRNNTAKQEADNTVDENYCCCQQAMQICHHLAAEDGMPPILGMNSALLTAIVDYVTQHHGDKGDDSSGVSRYHGTAYIHGIHILLALLLSSPSDDDFWRLSFPKLLPCVIDFGNQLCDMEMKRQVVSAITCFTKAN